MASAAAGVAAAPPSCVEAGERIYNSFSFLLLSFMVCVLGGKLTFLD